MWTPLIPIEKWTEKRAINLAIVRRISKIIDSAGWAGRASLWRKPQAGAQRRRGSIREDGPRIYTDDADSGREQKVAKEAKKCEQEAMEDSRRIRIHLLAGGLESGDG